MEAIRHCFMEKRYETRGLWVLRLFSIPLFRISFVVVNGGNDNELLICFNEINNRVRIFIYAQFIKMFILISPSGRVITYFL
jgi:hypothetical protein